MSDDLEQPAELPPLPAEPKGVQHGPLGGPEPESESAKAVREHRERLEEMDRKRGW